MSSAAPRSPLIDTLKGLACATIVWHHLAFYGPMSDVAMAWFPGVLAWLYEYGRMAIDLINGSPLLRTWVDDPAASPTNLDELAQTDETAWIETRRPFMLYPT